MIFVHSSKIILESAFDATSIALLTSNLISRAQHASPANSGQSKVKWARIGITAGGLQSMRRFMVKGMVGVGTERRRGLCWSSVSAWRGFGALYETSLPVLLMPTHPPALVDTRSPRRPQQSRLRRVLVVGGWMCYEEPVRAVSAGRGPSGGCGLYLGGLSARWHGKLRQGRRGAGRARLEFNVPAS